MLIAFGHLLKTLLTKLFPVAYFFALAGEILNMSTEVF